MCACLLSVSGGVYNVSNSSVVTSYVKGQCHYIGTVRSRSISLLTLLLYSIHHHSSVRLSILKVAGRSDILVTNN